MIRKVIKSFARRIEHHRNRVALQEAARRIFPDLQVLGGPFAGLKYPRLEGHGSAVLPKLLGTYEAELYDFFGAALDAKPLTIVDIGSAEGYYAVGLARLLPKAKVIAADISPKAQAMCNELAALNCVADRVQAQGEVTRDDLLRLAAQGSGLLICDCEGEEVNLFDAETFEALRDWWIIIELHEYLVPGVEETLIPLAQATHQVQAIDSVDDYRRQYRWRKQEVEHLKSTQRFEFYYEGRPALMRWLCAIPER